MKQSHRNAPSGRLRRCRGGDALVTNAQTGIRRKLLNVLVATRESRVEHDGHFEHTHSKPPPNSQMPGASECRGQAAGLRWWVSLGPGPHHPWSDVPLRFAARRTYCTVRCCQCQVSAPWLRDLHEAGRQERSAAMVQHAGLDPSPAHHAHALQSVANMARQSRARPA